MADHAEEAVEDGIDYVAVIAAEGAAFWLTSPCQGRWVRCGETRTHSPLNGS